jgi:two-component system cell cycle sensor histidine kinase/response regulator CckA
MPRMSGLDMAREIMKIRSDIPIIVCTGFSERLTEEEAYNIGISGFAMKPLDRKQLAELVRKVFDGEMRESTAST